MKLISLIALFATVAAVYAADAMTTPFTPHEIALDSSQANYITEIAQRKLTQDGYKIKRVDQIIQVSNGAFKTYQIDFKARRDGTCVSLLVFLILFRLLST